MATLNKLTIIGNLGKDPESRSTQGGKTFATFSVATEDYVGKDDAGKAKTKTTWHNVTVFGPQAEWVLKTLKKGHQVYVEGPLSKDEKDGKLFVNVLANQILLSNVKRDGNGNGSSESSSQGSSSNGSSSNGSSSSSNQTRQETATSAPVEEASAQQSYEESDLPF